MSRETGPLEGRHPTISPIRLLVFVAIIGAAYLTMPWWVGEELSANVWYLAAAVVGGGTAGVATAAARSRRPAAGRREPRRLSGSVGGLVVGATGGALLLRSVLDTSAIPWVLLAMIALATGMAGHTLFSTRRRPGR